MDRPQAYSQRADRTLLADPAHARLSDEQIVARVCAGELGLFELLMRRHNQRVFRAARAIVKRDDEAEDVMQDAYVRAYAHLGAFKGEASFATWLTRIAVHEALARLRRERRCTSMESPVKGSTSMPSDSHPSPEEQVSDAELRLVLDRAIDALPDDFRLAFVLRTIERLSGAETAEVLGIPEQTVKTRLFRARERLRRDLLAAIDANVVDAYAFHLSRCDRVVAAVLAHLDATADGGSEEPR